MILSATSIESESDEKKSLFSNSNRLPFDLFDWLNYHLKQSNKYQDRQLYIDMIHLLIRNLFNDAICWSESMTNHFIVDLEEYCPSLIRTTRMLANSLNLKFLSELTNPNQMFAMLILEKNNLLHSITELAIQDRVSTIRASACTVLYSILQCFDYWISTNSPIIQSSDNEKNSQEIHEMIVCYYHSYMSIEKNDNEIDSSSCSFQDLHDHLRIENDKIVSSEIKKILSLASNFKVDYHLSQNFVKNKRKKSAKDCDIVRISTSDIFIDSNLMELIEEILIFLEKTENEVSHPKEVFQDTNTDLNKNVIQESVISPIKSESIIENYIDFESDQSDRLLSSEKMINSLEKDDFQPKSIFEIVTLDQNPKVNKRKKFNKVNNNNVSNNKKNFDGQKSNQRTHFGNKIFSKKNLIHPIIRPIGDGQSLINNKTKSMASTSKLSTRDPQSRFNNFTIKESNTFDSKFSSSDQKQFSHSNHQNINAQISTSKSIALLPTPHLSSSNWNFQTNYRNQHHQQSQQPHHRRRQQLSKVPIYRNNNIASNNNNINKNISYPGLCFRIVPNISIGPQQPYLIRPPFFVESSFNPFQSSRFPQFNRDEKKTFLPKYLQSTLLDKSDKCSSLLNTDHNQLSRNDSSSHVSNLLPLEKQKCIAFKGCKFMAIVMVFQMIYFFP